jgi:hypothetical protein
MRKKMLDAAATRMNMLLQGVNLLATQYDQQVEAFPDFVHIPDEIALLFEDVSLFADPCQMRRRERNG